MYNERYFITFDGTEGSPFILDGKDVLKAFVRGRQIDLRKAPKPDIDAASFLAAHNELRTSGALHKLQSFDRAKRIANMKREYDEDFASLNAECGLKLTPSIAWNTVTDEQLQRYRSRDVGLECGQAAKALGDICEWDPRIKTRLQDQVRDYRCSFGENASLRIEKGVLHFTPASSVHSGADVLWKEITEALELPLTVLANKEDFIVLNSFVDGPVWSGSASRQIGRAHV